MFVSMGRGAAEVSLRARSSRRVATTLILWSLSATASHAVIIRGRVTDALGKGVPNGRVQLIEAGKVAAIAYAGPDGSYEIRSGDSGRFTLLGSASGFLPGIGVDFYGGKTDVLEQDVVLAANTVRQDVSVSATGISTPLPQLTAPVSVIAGETFQMRVGVAEEMRQTPGAFVVQTGQVGGVTSLFLRGGNSDSNKVLIDGIPAEDVGGVFDYGPVSSTGVGKLEIYRGPNSALYGSDALSSVVSVTTPRGSELKPLLDYSGDAGNLHTYRNEAALSGAYSIADYYAAFSRTQTSNALPNDEFHAATVVANLGFALPKDTLLRGTARRQVSATGVPNAHDFFGVSANTKEGDQDIYAQGTLENRTRKDWHNSVQYGVARKREEFTTFGGVGTAVVGPYGTTYYGNVVTIQGANGYKVTGSSPIAYSPLPASYLLVSDRDELYYQSDYAFTRHLTALFGFRYEDERGAYHYPLFGTNENLDRRNFEYTGQFQGDIKNRVFYSLGGAVEKNHLFGTRGTPRIGLAWAAVRPSQKAMHGTRLRANVSRGVQEPNLNTQFGSLYGTLAGAGNTTAIAAYGVTPIKAEEARTYDVGVEQNVLGTKLVVKAGYFHTQFDHEIEYVSSSALATYFGITKPISGVYGAYENSLTFRSQGFEGEAQYQATSHLFMRGGYTYLAPLVERSFSSDALRVYGSTTNPAFPGITIGSSSPLVGSHPFRRAPNTGFASVQYARGKYSAVLEGAFAGKSDDSTFLASSLLLPNQGLDYGYAKLDLGVTRALPHRLKFFAEVDNLMNNQHIGPIGYPGLPLTFRTGLKLKLGGE